MQLWARKHEDGKGTRKLTSSVAPSSKISPLPPLRSPLPNVHPNRSVFSSSPGSHLPLHRLDQTGRIEVVGLSVRGERVRFEGWPNEGRKEEESEEERWRSVVERSVPLPGSRRKEREDEGRVGRGEKKTSKLALTFLHLTPLQVEHLPSQPFQTLLHHLPMLFPNLASALHRKSRKKDDPLCVSSSEVLDRKFLEETSVERFLNLEKILLVGVPELKLSVEGDLGLDVEIRVGLEDSFAPGAHGGERRGSWSGRRVSWMGVARGGREREVSREVRERGRSQWARS